MAVRPRFVYSLLKMFFQLERIIKENSHKNHIYVARLLQYLLVNILARDVRTGGKKMHFTAEILQLLLLQELVGHKFGVVIAP